MASAHGSDSSKRKHLRHPDKVTYILGAGFSRPAGFPLLRDFLQQSLRILKEQPGAKDKGWGELDREAAEGFLGLMDKYAPIAARVGIDLNNLEDLFCLVDLPDEEPRDPGGLSRDGERSILNNMIVRTLARAQRKHDSSPHEGSEKHPCLALHRRYLYTDYGAEVHLECPSRGSSFGVCLYEAFVSYLLHSQRLRQPESAKPVYDLDAVITLNYDLILERAIVHFEGAQYYYGEVFGDENPAPEGTPEEKSLRARWRRLGKNQDKYTKMIPIVKLHGSINWYREEDTEGGASGAMEVPKIAETCDPCTKRVNAARVPLVAPTWRKEVSEETKTVFTTLMKDAIAHLRHASKIVIIGYSMPATDKYFRYVLAKGLETHEFPEIEIWNVESRAAMKSRIEDMFGSHAMSHRPIRYRRGGLDAFLAAHSRDRLSRRLVPPIRKRLTGRDEKRHQHHGRDANRP